jgi:glycosyltransferase involved in cell wall biosynthesis
MADPRSGLTVIVPTGSRADIIEDCLRSVRWADEVIVVDSFSTDGTVEVARRYADRVLQNEYGFSAKQKNWAIPQASNEWVLIVDTDERVTVELRDEIEQVLRAQSPHAGYRIPRLNILFGAPVKSAGYFPDYQVRLFRRDNGRYDMRRVHAHVVLDGSCGTVKAPLVHYAHRSLDQTLRNLLILMTTWEAEQREAQVRARGASPARTLPIDLLLRPIAAFGLRYFWQGGWREGYRGLIVSMIWAMYVAITYMKVWERGQELPDHWWQSDWQQRGDSIRAPRASLRDASENSAIQRGSEQETMPLHQKVQ